MNKLFAASTSKVHQTYEALRNELQRLPVVDENDANFLAGLKARMNAIEAMRNCVAHNRRPSRGIRDNYLVVRPQVEQFLDDFLARLSQAWRDETHADEMPWDTEARHAVETAMASADWDDEGKTITFDDADEARQYTTVSTRQELEDFLEEIATNAF